MNILFTGKVISISGDSARVSLIDESGREAFADCEACDLREKGIGKHDMFTLSFVKIGKIMEMEFELIPRKRLSSESIEKIRKDIAEELV